MTAFLADILGSREFFDLDNVLRLLSRLAINLLFVTVIIHGIYYRLYKNHQYVFTCYMFNAVTFCLTILLSRVSIELGFALGLFAVFGILRYRTEPIPIRDLTYLFVVIGIALINALSRGRVTVVELLIVNSVIAGLTALFELRTRNRRFTSTPANYDNLDLLHPGKEKELISDISRRTGLDVVRVDVERFDMLRDSAMVSIVYRRPA